MIACHFGIVGRHACALRNGCHSRESGTPVGHDVAVVMINELRRERRQAGIGAGRSGTGQLYDPLDSRFRGNDK